MPRITGRVEVLVNGEVLLNKAGAVASGIGLSGRPNFELEAIMGDSGHHGYIEKPILARCEVTITDRDDVLLDTFASIRENGTIHFRAAGGGKVYIMDGATCLRNITVTAGEGETPLIFEGPFWTETTQST